MLFRLWRQRGYNAADMEVARHNWPLAVLRRVHYDTAHPDLSALMYHTGYLTLTPPTTDTGAHAVAAWSLGRYDQEARRWQHEPCRVLLTELMHLPASERKRILREKQRDDDGGAHTVRLV